MYIDPFVRGGRRTGFKIGMLVAMSTSLLPEFCEAGDVSVAIHVDEAFVELIRGMRRAEGRDPPDAAADRRLRILVDRLQPLPSVAEASALPRVFPTDLPLCVELIGA